MASFALQNFSSLVLLPDRIQLLAVCGANIVLLFHTLEVFILSAIVLAPRRMYARARPLVVVCGL